MQKMNRNIAIGSIGGGGTVFAILAWLFEPKELMDFIMQNPKLILSMLLISLLIVAYLGKLLLDKNKELKELEEKEVPDNTSQLCKIEEGRKWKHTVLVIDDDPNVFKAIQGELQGYDVVCLEKIVDYRLAGEFEIIISDIFGCAASQTSTTASILNMIKEKYPYKFVLAMSGQPGASSKIDADNDIIYKDEFFQYIITIREKVNLLAKRLDNIEQHWTNTSLWLKEKNLSDTEIETYKNDYYRFICKIQNGL